MAKKKTTVDVTTDTAPDGRPSVKIESDQVEVDNSGKAIPDTRTELAATVVVDPNTASLLRERTIHFGPREPGNEQTEQLWQAIRFHTEQISFPAFQSFVTRVLGGKGGPAPGEASFIDQLNPAQRTNLERFRRDDCDLLAPFGGFVPGTDLYLMLRTAAEVFLLLRCGICPPAFDQTSGASGSASERAWGRKDIFQPVGDGTMDRGGLNNLQNALTEFLGEGRRSYIRGIIDNVFQDAGFQVSPFAPVSVGFGPCLLELIWSYWHEQAYQVQTMNALALRFQNVRLGRGRDPLAEFELDPLRPLGGFLWGYIQDAPHRLSVARRAYEYQHHYGLALYGRAVAGVRPADVRSRFLETFHDLLRMTARFYQEAADNTVTPDPFPLLVALRDLHLVLAEGAHNQFRDLPWTSRVEMLTEQWLLARPETREFLRGRYMVPYPEGWMGAVDSMKRLQGWTDANVIHFHDLAVFGERLLLSVRYVAWNEIADPNAAMDWALAWRPEVQGYIHAYRMATGVNLSDDMVEVRRTGDSRYLQPSFHLRNRQLEARRQRQLPSPSGDGNALVRQLGSPVPRGRRNRIT